MSFISNAPVAVQYFFLGLFLAWAIKLWDNWRKAKKDFPKVAYDANTLTAEHQWSWAIPPAELNLTVIDAENESTIHLPAKKSSVEIFGSVLAGLLALLGVYLIGVIIYRTAMDMPIFMGGSLFCVALIFAAASALTKLNVPLLAITRTPHFVRFTIRRAYYWQYQVVFTTPHQVGMSFEGKMQNFLTMTIDELESLPDYYLLVKTPWRTSQKFILRVNPSQGSWIVSGLNQWLEASLARQAHQTSV